ncbi:fasciclin domain-containing protein [Pedobacter frigoris]|uniref:fasciclin domain-containing protein n=1 Tax=Pedobacter frigoris TaxID=2571272 RepID=UPI002930E3A3|nr:fasciclin domain-containing protein [Pedobacter frigoris]
MKRKNQWLLMLSIITCIVASSCKKEYFNGGSVQNGVFKVSSYEFLKTNPLYFDTVMLVIDKAGMKDVLDKENVTFFIPTDHAIKKTMDALNQVRYFQSKDSVFIKDIPQFIWKKFLSQYIIKDKYLLKDIARYDIAQPNVFPGQFMASYDGYVMNLGVQFSDYQGTKDVGPRMLIFRNIGDMGNPLGITASVATSDIQTTNGAIHVLNDTHVFAFSNQLFINAVQEYFQ